MEITIKNPKIYILFLSLQIFHITNKGRTFEIFYILMTTKVSEPTF